MYYPRFDIYQPLAKLVLPYVHLHWIILKQILNISLDHKYFSIELQKDKDFKNRNCTAITTPKITAIPLHHMSS